MHTADIAKSTQCWCERMWAADLARSAPLTCSGNNEPETIVRYSDVSSTKTRQNNNNCIKITHKIVNILHLHLTHNRQEAKLSLG